MRSEQSGPFAIGFRILPLQPLVGKLHVTITADLVDSGEPVTDARVRLTARHADEGGAARFSPGLSVPTEPRFFDANFDLEDGGQWEFFVEVESPAESGEVKVPVFIAERRRGESLGTEGTIVFGLITGVLVAITFWVTLTARRNQRARRAAAKSD